MLEPHKHLLPPADNRKKEENHIDLKDVLIAGNIEITDKQLWLAQNELRQYDGDLLTDSQSFELICRWKENIIDKAKICFRENITALGLAYHPSTDKVAYPLIVITDGPIVPTLRAEILLHELAHLLCHEWVLTGFSPRPLNDHGQDWIHIAKSLGSVAHQYGTTDETFKKWQKSKAVTVAWCPGCGNEWHRMTPCKEYWQTRSCGKCKVPLMANET